MNMQHESSNMKQKPCSSLRVHQLGCVVGWQVFYPCLYTLTSDSQTVAIMSTASLHHNMWLPGILPTTDVTIQRCRKIMWLPTFIIHLHGRETKGHRSTTFYQTINSCWIRNNNCHIVNTLSYTDWGQPHRQAMVLWPMTWHLFRCNFTNKTFCFDST